MPESTNTPSREKLTLTSKEARQVIYGDLEGFEVIQDEISGTRRWSVDHYVVIKRLSDGKFFADGYSVGATESQDERAWEYDDPDFTEVFPKTISITTYE